MRDRGRLLAGAVWIVTFVTFLPALRNDFVNWDDVENFLLNPRYRGLGWDNLRWMFTAVHLGHYIPVTWLTLGLDYLLWGMNPAGYHLTSNLIHALNAVLVFLLASRLLALGLADTAPLAMRLGAGVAALLFAVHPLRVESVVWITERRDVVMGAFALLSTLAYLTAVERGCGGRLHGGWFGSAVALFALALLSKSQVVGLPVVLLALDVFPLRRLDVAAGSRRRRLVRLAGEKAPFIAPAGVIAGLMLVLGARRELMTPLEILGVVDRLAVSVYGLAFYLWKTLVPWPLSPLYALELPVDPLTPRYVASAIAVGAITTALVAARRRWPAGLTVWTAYVAMLLPVLGIVHNGNQVAADRYTYLASIGWAVLAGAVAARGGARGAPARVLAATLVILAFTTLTGFQILVWRDSLTLWTHAVTVEPGNPHARYHLANVLAGAGRTQEARAEYQRALALAPQALPNARAVFHASLGALLQGQGDVAGAERHYREALRFSEDNVIARNNLGVILVERGELSEALDHFRHALRVIPGYPAACVGAAHVAAELGVEVPELRGCPSRRSGREPEKTRRARDDPRPSFEPSSRA